MNSDHCTSGRRHAVVTDSARDCHRPDSGTTSPRPCCVRPAAPRLRGVRRAARHGHPARGLPARQHAAVRARAGRAAQRLAGDAARGDGRAATGRAGRDHAAAAVAAPSSPSSRARRPRALPPGSHRSPAPGVARRAGLPAGRRAWRGQPGRPRASSTTPARWPSSTRRTRRSRAPSTPAEHRQADSRFHLTVAALTGSPRMVEAVTSVQATLHEMLLAIPCSTPTSPTPTASTRVAGPRDPAGATTTAPAR